jgi:hypothetical protein
MNKTIFASVFALFLAACQSTPAPPPDAKTAATAASPAPSASAAPTMSASAAPAMSGAAAPASTAALSAWGSDGRTYSGAPAPGRGGSYQYSFCANGKYQRWCLDAACDAGTYTRAGTKITLKSTRPDTKGKESTITLSADEREIDDGLGMGKMTFKGSAKDVSACK